MKNIKKGNFCNYDIVKRLKEIFQRVHMYPVHGTNINGNSEIW